MSSDALHWKEKFDRAQHRNAELLIDLQNSRKRNKQLRTHLAHRVAKQVGQEVEKLDAERDVLTENATRLSREVEVLSKARDWADTKLTRAHKRMGKLDKKVKAATTETATERHRHEHLEAQVRELGQQRRESQVSNPATRRHVCAKETKEEYFDRRKWGRDKVVQTMIGLLSRCNISLDELQEQPKEENRTDRVGRNVSRDAY